MNFIESQPLLSPLPPQLQPGTSGGRGRDNIL